MYLKHVPLETDILISTERTQRTNEGFLSCVDPYMLGQIMTETCLIGTKRALVDYPEVILAVGLPEELVLAASKDKAECWPLSWVMSHPPAFTFRSHLLAMPILAFHKEGLRNVQQLNILCSFQCSVWKGNNQQRKVNLFRHLIDWRKRGSKSAVLSLFSGHAYVSTKEFQSLVVPLVRKL